MRVAPFFRALEGCPRLEELTMSTFQGAVEEDLCIRLAHMPALRSCELFRLGTAATRPWRMEVEGLPSLEALLLDYCGAVELPHSLALSH